MTDKKIKNEPHFKTCTCPSGDGSLQWPCPVHPPEKTLFQYCQECADEVAKWPAHMKVNISGYVPSPDSPDTEVPTAKTYRIRSIKDLFLIPAERMEDALKEIGLGIAGFKAFSTGSDQPSQVLEYVDWTDDGKADWNFKILPGGLDYPTLLEPDMDNKALFVQMMPQIVHESQKGYDFASIFDYLTAKPDFAGEGWLLAAKAMEFGLRHQQSYINELVAENTNLIKANIDVASINGDYLFETIELKNANTELQQQVDKLAQENINIKLVIGKHALSTFVPLPQLDDQQVRQIPSFTKWVPTFVAALFILAVVWSFVEFLTS